MDKEMAQQFHFHKFHPNHSLDDGRKSMDTQIAPKPAICE